MASSSSSSLPLQQIGLPAHHVPPLKNPLALLLHRRQQDNPMVKFIKNVPKEVSDEITPDFIVGSSACVVYVELAYHLVLDYISTSKLPFPTLFHFLSYFHAH